MNGTFLNSRIAGELHKLVAQRVLTHEQMERIAQRYPTGRWDVIALIRCFTLLGAVSAGAGAVMLISRWAGYRVLLEAGLLLAAVVCVGLGRWLGARKEMPKTGTALELCGGFALQGLTVALAMHYTTDREQWPILIGLDSALLIALAYVLKNRLILAYACANLFVFFGGETGYISGWGAYWLGMNYPLRFLAAGTVTLGVAWTHFRWLTGGYQAFSRTYVHFGLLVINLSLWFFAVFGYFETEPRWHGTEGERLLFSMLWGACSGLSLYYGIRLGFQVLRSYGLTFLIINVYTFYFQFVVVSSLDAWWLHLLLMGGSLLMLGYWLELKRRLRSAPGGGPMSLTGGTPGGGTGAPPAAPDPPGPS